MRRVPCPMRDESGYSLVEVLIATLLFFFIAIGVIPLFTRSMVANRAGRDATSASQYGLSRVEALMAPPFNTVLPGTASEYFSINDEEWKPGATAPSGDSEAWTRVTTVSQHSLSDLEDDGVLDEALPDDAPESEVHLKLIEVRVGMVRDEGNPIGRRRDLDLRAIRPY